MKIVKSWLWKRLSGEILDTLYAANWTSKLESVHFEEVLNFFFKVE